MKNVGWTRVVHPTLILTILFPLLLPLLIPNRTARNEERHIIPKILADHFLFCDLLAENQEIIECFPVGANDDFDPLTRPVARKDTGLAIEPAANVSLLIFENPLQTT